MDKLVQKVTIRFKSDDRSYIELTKIARADGMKYSFQTSDKYISVIKHIENAYEVVSIIPTERLIFIDSAQVLESSLQVDDDDEDDDEDGWWFRLLRPSRKDRKKP